MNTAHAVKDHSHSADHGHDPHDFAHPMPVWMLLAVFFALSFLTVITVWQTNFDLGSADVIVVMAIATVKATLVMLFFMHLAYDKPFNLIIFLSAFVFVALFIIFTLGDSQLTKFAFEPVVDEAPRVIADTAEHDIAVQPEAEMKADAAKGGVEAEVSKTELDAEKVETPAADAAATDAAAEPAKN